MTLRVPAAPLFLLGATLLLGTLGCSKKDAPTPSNIGSYKLDGVLRNCTAETYGRSVVGVGYNYEELTVYLTTTPQPANGFEALKVIFVKGAGQADTTYRCSDLYFYTNGEKTFPAGAFYTYSSAKSPLMLTGSNEISGIFSGWAVRGQFSYGSITDGVFTRVRR
jgi:hypothetical protein